MAVDTRARRASCLRVGRPYMVCMPPADAAVAAADRRHLGFCYAGIAAFTPVSNPDVVLFTLNIDRAQAFDLAMSRTPAWDLNIDRACSFEEER